MSKGGGQNKVFVGGLPQDCTDDLLTEYFSKFGTLTDVVVMKDRETGRSRGFGFVSFDTPAAVDEVMAIKDEHRIREKWVDCKRATTEGSKGAPAGKAGGKGSGGFSGGSYNRAPPNYNQAPPPGGDRSSAYGAYGAYGAGAPPPSYGGGYGASGAYGAYGGVPGGYGAPPAYGYGGYGAMPGAYGGGGGGGGGGKGYSPY
eukprot:TRINITY_DN38071_c0_g1_i1.p1 TRINITY_DN38071_c0_g1~~TRINITY_DN38071_c0_g1_i1.p1  ORF type:complete len:201 (+),score=30.24 TRINITY_DN38071_c0_g1_i1:92-694(+)